MTSIVYDYADIRSRMLGDDKPAPKKQEVWFPKPEYGPMILGVDPGSDQTIIRTKLPPGTWRKLIDGPPPSAVGTVKQFFEIEDEKWREIVKRYGL